MNDQYVMVGKMQGEAVRQTHHAEDEMFLVISGRLRIRLSGDEEMTLTACQ